ncbi:hypothetical protein ELH48_03455 [Rhizobium ruizarguesonis]|nr:hypothetical protein ELH48_03455 [Rhizobium ruizarguesonis]TBB43186.1 hypothetical protein ELH49_03445 [Rhizobium ruizarguesonis]
MVSPQYSCLFHKFLIPVLVTGIQPRRVGAVNDCQHPRPSSAPKDLGALDSCDKHRNEGELGNVRLQQQRPA